MIVLTNYEQARAFHIVIGQYMRKCILNFNNDDFELKEQKINVAYTDMHFYRKQFKTQNTKHKIKSIIFEILKNGKVWSINAYITMFNAQNGYYRYKVYEMPTKSGKNYKLEIQKQN